jgi:hypothetical protein
MVIWAMMRFDVELICGLKTMTYEHKDVVVDEQL